MNLMSYTDTKTESLIKEPVKPQPKFRNHFIAILFRKSTLLKRSYKSIFIASIGSIFFCGLAILISFLMKWLIHDQVKKVNFDSFKPKTNEIFLVVPPDANPIKKAQINKSIETLRSMFYNDTGKYPNFTFFDNRTQINHYMYHNAEYFLPPLYVAMGIDFTKSFDNIFLPYDFMFYYNVSWYETEFVCEVQVSRLAWKLALGKENDYSFTSTRLLKRTTDIVFSMIGPILICAGLTSMIPLFIYQPITDIKGDVRSYMESCGLTHFPYWFATFIVDCLTWFVVSSITWLMFYFFKTEALIQNKLITYYIFIMSGPAFIMFVYCIAFAFDSAEAAPRQSFIILVIIMIFPIIAQLVSQPEEPPLWTDVIFALIPNLSLQRLSTIVLSNIYILNHNFTWYWHNKTTLIYLCGEFVNIFLYGFVLLTIEMIRKKISARNTKRHFGNYSEFFAEQKRLHPVTQESIYAANKAQNPNEDFAVRIENVSRLFFNTQGEPVPAVNQVSLGVKRGTIFGFLGANGAGKTTLIKMITAMLPPSEGKIFIDGEEVSLQAKRGLAICPQFNSHLCMEMTPVEHFRMYTRIYNISKEEGRERSEKLIDILGLRHYKDKIAGELSGGEQRKLAIAITFLGPSEIILLDEPTSSLDPVARHKVHELISSSKGEKTFMLCTHLLSEAESLCDMISIMIKGNVYTVGSPQYLSVKFGTEYKIDVSLDNHEGSASKFDKFAYDKLPTATLSINRPNARIYSMPASDIDIVDLFDIMEKGATGENGYTYYTCSTSSLERVFMEIVHMSENNEYERVAATL